VTPGRPIELTLVLDSVVRLREQQLWPQPDVLEFALAAERAGIDGVLLGLHVSHVAISDRNWHTLDKLSRSKLCLAAPLRLDLLQRIAESKAKRCVLVPVSRHEHSSGGALAVSAVSGQLPAARSILERSDTEFSARIDPDLTAVSQCVAAGMQAVEFNTSAFALAGRAEIRARRRGELADAISAARDAGLRVSVRGGVDYGNIAELAGCYGLAEIKIGQALIAQALFDGIEVSIARMRDLLGG
jgi:pyridoxine 5-phosphate synthase